jgi:hypothetical protein
MAGQLGWEHPAEWPDQNKPAHRLLLPSLRSRPAGGPGPGGPHWGLWVADPSWAVGIGVGHAGRWPSVSLVLTSSVSSLDPWPHQGPRRPPRHHGSLFFCPCFFRVWRSTKMRFAMPALLAFVWFVVMATPDPGADPLSNDAVAKKPKGPQKKCLLSKYEPRTVSHNVPRPRFCFFLSYDACSLPQGCPFASGTVASPAAYRSRMGNSVSFTRLSCLPRASQMDWQAAYAGSQATVSTLF